MVDIPTLNPHNTPLGVSELNLNLIVQTSLV